ncbi:MAG: hypothetical protein HYW26_05085 [Candidatus Aenigmarchaeota archaeon]|nr:hypothetical protein [Candidatus Aenigmarchaeota archaeon]
MKKSDIAFIILFTLMAGFLGGIYVSSLQKPETKVLARFVNGEREVVTYLPAVDTKGNGVVGILKTTVKPGKGGVSVDVSNVLSYLDTQQSAKIAADVARNYTGIDTSNLDINYAIEVNATAVEGTSAGAAMAVSVIAALQSKTLNSSVFMTGTIEPDGSIGRVGAIVEKARAAKDAGATMFLVPKGQATSTELKRQRECRNVGFINYCEVTYKQQSANITGIAGISVVEVRNVGDAARHMVVEK